MGVVLRRNHRRLIPTLIVFAFLFLLSSSSSSAAAASLNSFSGGFRERRKERSESGLSGRILYQKRLDGPGSAPPRCRWKCDKCEPCKAVHVPIQPLEYYPEAWRCKCGNKIFMP